ncbi:MAG TPA: diphosphomevalonate decarboxylase [Candidatus Aquilonibacter sp.]|nr:diphosphomevalonate decarboxylase [Candidatus Aquilonibacter sp.]
MEEIFTAIGTPNIALIKYWGKRDQKLILPANSSISITLSENLNTKTSVIFSKKIREDRFYINGESQDLNDKEIQERFDVINSLRQMAGTKDRIVVASKNSFPTASGLASSASGIATLIYAASNALDLKLNQKQMSIFARQGSGSACRSLFGGFVKWNMGEKKDGSDSYAEQIVSERHWPEITDIVAVVSSSKKKVSSRAGMQQTMKTSELYPARISALNRRIDEITDAIKSKDFETMAKITMQDSNTMHATMLDTWPPIFYMNDVSREIVYKIHELNDSEGKIIAGYTFDAGPNPHIITTSQNRKRIMRELKTIKGIEEFIETQQGSGPRMLENEDAIINEKMQPM